MAHRRASRRILLIYPPVSSVWHLPAGLAQLTSVLRACGHEVLQRYGHIHGLEYVLKAYGGTDVVRALETVRDPKSDVLALHAARTTFERVSRGIATPDKFEVARNNASYVSSHYDGTVARALEAVRDRERHLWYDYFAREELPAARAFRPQVYGIAVSDERQFIQALVLASMVKEELPQCLVVLGGNFWSRVALAFKTPEFARFFDFCDAIVYREGFQPLQELAAELTPARASGTAWRNTVGEVVINSPARNPTDFEALPAPSFDGVARQWSPDVVPSLYTSSNCPMSCGFCAIAAGSDTYLGRPRSMSARRVAEHMAVSGASRFDVCDELFPVNRQLALGDALRRIGHKATWQCYLTVTHDLTRPETCQWLYEAGCRAVQLGLETLSPDTLARENKRWNAPESYGIILDNLKAAGIQTHVFLMVGVPGEPLHWGLRWLPFLERHGDSVLTIKSSRYRLTRHSPEERSGTHDGRIERLPHLKPLRLNEDFRYRNLSNKRVDAMRDLLEAMCRRHWAYGVTSTVPWWVNRGRYAWEDLRAMAPLLPPEEDIRHLDDVLTRVRSIVRDEQGRSSNFNDYEGAAAFARAM